jgi:hypothetical protein
VILNKLPKETMTHWAKIRPIWSSSLTLELTKGYLATNIMIFKILSPKEWRFL